MKIPQVSLALLCAVLAFAATFYCGSLFFLLFHPRYHDGVAPLGGLCLALIAGIFSFKAVYKRL